jgi:hypothetical protein
VIAPDLPGRRLVPAPLRAFVDFITQEAVYTILKSLIEWDEFSSDAPQRLAKDPRFG